MTDEAAFIQTIREHPDDDGPRLVYADWLEEHGQCERAEFIRVQIELARGVADHERRAQLLKREKDLRQEWEPIWVGAVADWINDICEFHRGMIELIHIRAEDFIRRGDEILDRAPIRRVRLLRIQDFNRLITSPTFARVRELDLSGNHIEGWHVFGMARCHHFRQLRLLDMSLNQIGPSGVQSIMGSLCFEGLTDLRLGGIGLNGGEWIRDCRRLPNLTALALDSNEIGDSGVEILARASNFQNLRRLDLSHCEFGSRGADSLASSKRLSHLVFLDLSSNRISDLGAEAIANSPLLGGLESLILRNCDIGWPGAKAIAQSQMLEGLKHLDLSGNRLNSRQQNRLELRFGSRVKF